MVDRRRENARQAVALLATTVVLVLGAVLCGFTVLVAAENPIPGLWVWVLLFVGVVVFLVSLLWPSDESPGGTLWITWRKAADQVDEAALYQPKRRKRMAPVSLSNSLPPTAEKVRELKEFGTQWVPRGPAPERPAPERPAPQRLARNDSQPARPQTMHGNLKKRGR